MTPKPNILLLPGEPVDDRARLLCEDCGERLRYPDDDWGSVTCGCDDPPGWVIV